jgi:hypothetical protein
MIWSKPQINESNNSLCKTLQPFNGDYHSVSDLLFINDEFNFLIACCDWECKLVIYNEGEKEEELEHERVRRLIPMSNGRFSIGGWKS